MKGKSVLIVEDDRAYSTLLATRCQQLGLKVHVAADAMTAVDLLSEQSPDLILLDVELPGRTGEPTEAYGLVMAATLRRIMALDLPIIMLTGRNDADVVWRCREAAVRHVHKSPQSWKALRAAIHELLEAPETAAAPALILEESDSACGSADIPQTSRPSSPKILCVDDDCDFTLALCIRLKELGAIPVRAFSGTQGFVVALAEKPDLVITDLHMPDGEGNYLIERLKSNSLTKDIPIVVLTGQRNPGVLLHVRSLGANACLSKPFAMSTLVNELNQHITLPALHAAV
ncbi:Response regulator receiver domain-containing protein [Planctomicrobium piriforme]|uniref:Response regulator receiver domain-containing protein n=2 Tax=Planctomicrobium piriforme TaxID=1576369 RepID=A0A1I3SQ97_9PLAN|nr:Response regulator receiver domain-containing protein [Planctomicrobium piriforme]